MGRSSLLVGNLKKKYAQGLLAEKLPQQDNTTTTDSEMEEPYVQGRPWLAGCWGCWCWRRQGRAACSLKSLVALMVKPLSRPTGGLLPGLCSWAGDPRPSMAERE